MMKPNPSSSTNGQLDSDSNPFSNIEEKHPRVRGRYLFADIRRCIKEFFFGEVKEKDEKLYERQLIDVAVQKAKEKDDVGEIMETQRFTNDTLARRRLEKWVTRVIVCYLIVVSLFLVASIVAKWLLCCREVFSDTILITILSTTTVNILGLGYIVLKGQFGGKEVKEPQ